MRVLLVLVLLAAPAWAGGKQLANGSFKVCKAKSGSGKQLGNGVACTFDSDCASGRCSFKVCKLK